MKKPFDYQHRHWELTYSEEPRLFGEEPSYAGERAAALFKTEGKEKVLDLGCGHGRDSLFLAQNGFGVWALDYSTSALRMLTRTAHELHLPESIAAIRHDIREPIPFVDASFDGCYSHMLYCMALTTAELEFLSSEVWRVLRPNGINIYTVRNTGDPHYGKGIHRGEDIYEVDGFAVHFFSNRKIEYLAKGYRLQSVENFEEGELPRRLSLVILKKELS